MAASQAPSRLDPERDFERLRPLARRRFLARARRAGQAGRVDLDAAADDAYQEAWLELQRRPGDAAIEHDPASYLAGIMWHRFHRLELRPARVDTDPLADDSPSGDDGPDAVVERRQTLAAVRDALAELPERERTAVLLRADGLGHDDIAATLGVSRRIARKLVERGRARLTDELGAEERCASIASTLRAIGLGWPVRGDRRARLDDHLAHCATCRGTVAALRHEGALAATPVLAGTSALTRLRELLEGVFGRGGGEAVAAAAGAKVVAGCLAAGVCVVGVAQLTPPADPRPAPAAPVARAPVKPEAAPAAGRRGGDGAAPGGRPAHGAADRSAARHGGASTPRSAQVQTAVERAREGAEAGAGGGRAGSRRGRAGARHPPGGQ